MEHWSSSPSYQTKSLVRKPIWGSAWSDRGDKASGPFDCVGGTAGFGEVGTHCIGSGIAADVPARDAAAGVCGREASTAVEPLRRASRSARLAAINLETSMMRSIEFEVCLGVMAVATGGVSL